MKSYFIHKMEYVRFCEIAYILKDIQELVIKVKSVGIYGFDIHYYKNGKIGYFTPKETFPHLNKLDEMIDL